MGLVDYPQPYVVFMPMIPWLCRTVHAGGDYIILKTLHLTSEVATGLAPIAPRLWLSTALTVVFAALGWAVRGVTSAGALAGALACFALLLGTGVGGFAALLMVFVVTWITTRIGYARKQKLGTAEARTGRGALQVLANLGVASAVALAFATVWPDRRMLVAVGAALSEAAADTVSSEIGQAAGAIPRLVTTWERAAPGTDGAVSFAGTLAGTAAAVILGLTCALTRVLPWHSLAISSGAGVAGMFLDSFLGATLERKGRLGNNAVNFFSTAIAALAGFLLA